MRYTSDVHRSAPFLVLATLAVGCHLIGGTNEFIVGDGGGGSDTATTTSTGLGGASSASSSSSSASTGVGGQAPECTKIADCTDAATCQFAQCIGNECSYPTSPRGTECLIAPPATTGVCSDSGLCVECIESSDCPNLGDTCEPNNTCKANHCENMFEDTNMGETGVDCGGPCPACPNGQGCNDASDCQTLFCSTSKVCSNCTDPDSCGVGFYCSQLDNECKPKEGNGSPCAADYVCASDCCFGVICGFSSQC